MTRHVVRVDSGKYTFVRGIGGGIEILRHGEPWHEQTEAANAVSSIMAELDAARVVVAGVRRAFQAGEEQNATDRDVILFIRGLLDKHARLVDDREPPSDWAAPTEPTP